MACEPSGSSKFRSISPTKLANKPPFQLRLSTCIILLFTAGCLFFLNSLSIQYEEYTARGLPLHYESSSSLTSIPAGWAIAINAYVGLVVLTVTAHSLEWIYRKRQEGTLAMELATGALIIAFQFMLHAFYFWLAT